MGDESRAGNDADDGVWVSLAGATTGLFVGGKTTTSLAEFDAKVDMLMRHILQRHPVSVRAFFRRTLVLTYALPEESLVGLLPPGLALDTYREFGFLAIAMVQTEGLRPVWLPPQLGRDFFLSGYRVFARYRTESGHTLRGLRILRSDTDSCLMQAMGNLLTHYNYHKAAVTVGERSGYLDVEVRTAGGVADLRVRADLVRRPAPLPWGSPFESVEVARRFAGPLPFTFDYEPQTHSMIVIEGVRDEWRPEPVTVNVLENSFFARPCWKGVNPILANAFYLSNVPYKWRRGVRHPLEGGAA